MRAMDRTKSRAMKRARDMDRTKARGYGQD